MRSPFEIRSFGKCDETSLVTKYMQKISYDEHGSKNMLELTNTFFLHNID